MIRMTKGLAVTYTSSSKTVEAWRAAVTRAERETRQLAEVRKVLADFDWEFDDRQLALEAIERIVYERIIYEGKL